MTREILQMHSDRINRLESKLEIIDEKIESEWRETMESIHKMEFQLKELIDRQKSNQPAIESIDRIMHGSVLLKWVILFVVGSLAAIGTFATAVEALRKLWPAGH